MSGADCQWQHIYPVLTWSPLSTKDVLEVEFGGKKLHNTVTKSILFSYQLQLLHLWVNLEISSSVPDCHWANGLLKNIKNKVTLASRIFSKFSTTWGISHIGCIPPQMCFVLCLPSRGLSQILSTVTLCLSCMFQLWACAFLVQSSPLPWNTAALSSVSCEVLCLGKAYQPPHFGGWQDVILERDLIHTLTWY